MAPKILVVLTSTDKIESAGKPTGWFLPELAHPYDILAPKAEFTFASPKGGVAPLDPASVEAFAKDESSTNFHKNKKALWENTEKLENLAGKASDFDAIFYPGGHGPMFDLVSDKASQQLIADFYNQGKPVAAVCHGPAVLLHVTLPSGEPLVKGKEVTGFTNDEEEQFNYTKYMPFLLETELDKKSGGKFVKAEPWAEKVVVEGNLITGQNPASAKGVGLALAKALGI